jgi:CRP-like cAMP-binding protein
MVFKGTPGTKSAESGFAREPGLIGGCEHNHGVATSDPAAESVDFLSLLSDVNRRRILERSTPTVYSAGALAFHLEGPPRAFLVGRGLVRLYCSSPDGRQASVAFLHSNELVGGTTIVSQPLWTSVQVVVESTLTTLDIEIVRTLAAREIEVVAAIATHLAARIRSGFRLIAVRSLGNIRERLAYDLLDPVDPSWRSAGSRSERLNPISPIPSAPHARS